ncbi:MAG TPA: DUF192 domain-containing protein [Steroidobacteraceae bacterium]|jgi:hypothetical protein
MRTGHLFCALTLLLLTAATSALPQAANEAPEPLSAFPQSMLSIRTQTNNVVNFKIWTADTPKRDQQGLMFVKSMAEHQGMLFLFPQVRPQVAMWMKNTYIPLDMLFMDRFGRVDYIKANAKPFSEDIIASPGPEYAVLELNGGAAARLGISVGDTVVHAAFRKRP